MKIKTKITKRTTITIKDGDFHFSHEDVPESVLVESNAKRFFNVLAKHWMLICCVGVLLFAAPYLGCVFLGSTLTVIFLDMVIEFSN